MNKLLAILLTTSFAISTSALAHEVTLDMGEYCTSHSKVTFEEADKDKDGTLDREEAKQVCKEKFSVMDTDKDGTISKDELNACGRTKHKTHHKPHKKNTK